jgi:clan AA aspartic protease (TIGR02281 family)
LTAIDWFERGVSLDDESEAEVECYENAIRLDPNLAPAYFRLGAIYYRRANYESADQEFAKFLEKASDADKVGYNIYVYYSPSDVDRLTAEDTGEAVQPEEAETETEIEEAEQASGVEGEDVEEKTPSETETETEEAAGEEESEETGEEVNTIVRFLAYNGHIVVPVTLNGIEDAQVLVDTGSSITVLSREMAERLDLEKRAGKGVTLRTMASDIEADLVMLSSIQVGDLVQNNLAVAVTDLPTRVKADFDGILGMDFMNHYKIRIDNDNQRIVFSPGKRGW